MPRLVTIRIAHRHGKDEAMRRLRSGIDQARSSFAGTLGHIDEQWQDDHLDFRVAALGQTVIGTVDVHDTYVDAAFELPLALAFLARRIKGVVERHGQLMLERK